MFLQPSIRADEADIARYNKFLAKLEGKEKNEYTLRLIKWVKESIQDMQEKKAARDFSRSWSKSQHKL